MAEYHHRGYSATDLKYHQIWVTKCRFAVLKGDVAVRCRDLIREICQAREVSVARRAYSFSKCSENHLDAIQFLVSTYNLSIQQVATLD